MVYSRGAAQLRLGTGILRALSVYQLFDWPVSLPRLVVCRVYGELMWESFSYKNLMFMMYLTVCYKVAVV